MQCRTSQIRLLLIAIFMVVSSIISVKCQVRPCASNPCKNGAKCVDQPGSFYGYSCQCDVDRWTGINCEQSKQKAGEIGRNYRHHIDAEYPYQHAHPNHPSAPHNPDLLNNPLKDMLNNPSMINQNYLNNQMYRNPNDMKYQNYPASLFNNQHGQYANSYNTNQYGSNVQYQPNNNNNQYLNSEYRPPNQLQYHQPAYGQSANVYGGGLQQQNPCQQRPCYNEGQCMPTGPYTFQCQCRYSYYGERCENYRNPKAVLIGIVLGTVLPFFAIVIVGSCVAYFCCCKKRKHQHIPVNQY